LEKEKKVDLHGEHEGGEPVVVPDVQADGRLLQQILHNLKETVSRDGLGF
jgi:hypothetical protein